jgi:hypothetical protein
VANGENGHRGGVAIRVGSNANGGGIALDGGNSANGGSFADGGHTHQGCNIAIDHDCFNQPGRNLASDWSGTHDNGSTSPWLNLFLELKIAFTLRTVPSIGLSSFIGTEESKLVRKEKNLGCEDGNHNTVILLYSRTGTMCRKVYS